MGGIQNRLKLMFVLIVTVVLSLSGAYTQFMLGQQLEEQHQQMRTGVVTRLQTSLPTALWDLDKSKVESIIAAEMLPRELVSIQVFDTAMGLFAGKLRLANGALVSPPEFPAPPDEAVQASLVFRDENVDGGKLKGVPVGQIALRFSRAANEATLKEEFRRKLVEVLLLDLILVLALSLSLRVVFAPLKQLRDALFDLAARDSGEMEELAEHRRDELGEVIRGFNLIQRRLQSTIARSREAEEAARRASGQTEQALRELRQTQESLIQAERLASLGGLVAGVAHEINTPVGIALTGASVLKEATDKLRLAVEGGGVRKPEFLAYLATADESATLIMNNAYRAAHLIHSFKQIAVDQTSEERRPFALAAYIEEIIASLQPRLKKSPVQLVLDCAAEIELDSYPGAFAQVLTNLVINCVEHAFSREQGGRIDIGARCEGAQLHLWVADNGKGIEPALIERIFDPFFTTRRGQGGTGLGLNIVYNLVAKRFCGTIAVHSTLGQGCRFTLRLPLVTPPDCASAAGGGPDARAD